jgi:hypothetical protein
LTIVKVNPARRRGSVLPGFAWELFGSDAPRIAHPELPKISF